MIRPSKDLNYWLCLPFMACFEGNYNEHAIKQNMNPQAIWAMADPLLLGVCRSLSPCSPAWARILKRHSNPSLLLDPRAGVSSLHAREGRTGRRRTVVLSLSLHTCQDVRCCFSPAAVSSRLVVFFFFFFFLFFPLIPGESESEESVSVNLGTQKYL